MSEPYETEEPFEEHLPEPKFEETGDYSEFTEERANQMQQPQDKQGNDIGVEDILVGDSGNRFKVVAIDHLQGSGAATVECLDPVEPGWERRGVSRYDLKRYYTIETKAVHEYPPSDPDLLAEYEHRKRGEEYQNEKEQREAIRDTQCGVDL